MKKTALLTFLLPLAGCLGHSSRHNELVGQVKRVQHMTPMSCPNWDHVDISLGTMRNGVGSMSNQDLWLWVPNRKDMLLLEAAARDGRIVKVMYDIARWRFWFNCEELEEVTSVEVLP